MGDDFGSSALVQNNSDATVYVRSGDNPASVAMVAAAGAFGGGDFIPLET
jgi:hypothetical protein